MTLLRRSSCDATLNSPAAKNKKLEIYTFPQHGQILHVCTLKGYKNAPKSLTNNARKYDFKETFGTVNTPPSNILWTPENAPTDSAGRTTSAGCAFVGANEEVLCWDVKKGELLSRWRDSACRAQVTAIARSKADKDIFAVGYECWGISASDKS